jgi:hypothetical protein
MRFTRGIDGTGLDKVELPGFIGSTPSGKIMTTILGVSH